MSDKDSVEQVYDSLINGQNSQAVHQILQGKIDMSELAHMLISHSEFKDGVTITLSRLLFVAYQAGYYQDKEEN